MTRAVLALTWPLCPESAGHLNREQLTALRLKKEATKPAAANVLQQQARFDAFVTQYNQERPHQALGKCYLCPRPPASG